MKPTFVLPLLIVLLGSAGLVLAQDRKPLSDQETSQFVVSARAGGINLADGDVTVKKSEADWQIAVVGDSLEAGQTVKTGADSRAEVLLNPGSYLRVNENTQFAFDSTNLNDLRVRLIEGSAIVEVASPKGTEGRLMTIATPHKSFEIARAGVYRFNVSSNGSAQAEVFKGRLNVDRTEVKEGKKAVVDGATAEISGFNSKDLDSFELWSRDRAKSLVAANGTVMNSQVAQTSVGGFSSGFLGFWGDPFYSCSGWWGFDPFLGSFIYLPSSFGGCSYFGSPYGWGYSAYCSPYRHWRPVVSPPPNHHHHHGGSSGGNGTLASRGSGNGGRIGGGPAKGSNTLGIQRPSSFSGGHGSSWGGGGRVGGSSRISTGGTTVSAPRSSAPVSSAGGHGSAGHSH